MDHSEKIFPSKEIVGATVKNLDRETLGKIEEIVLDKLTGQTVYLVLACDTIFGMGGKYFALPWKALSYDAYERSYILDMDKDTLKNAPGFDKTYYPDTADAIFSRYTEKSY